MLSSVSRLVLLRSDVNFEEQQKKRRRATVKLKNFGDSEFFYLIHIISGEVLCKGWQSKTVHGRYIKRQGNLVNPKKKKKNLHKKVDESADSTAKSVERSRHLKKVNEKYDNDESCIVSDNLCNR